MCKNGSYAVEMISELAWHPLPGTAFSEAVALAKLSPWPRCEAGEKSHSVPPWFQIVA